MDFLPVFALRLKKLPDVYIYNKPLPKELKRKLAHLILQATGRWISGTVADERGNKITTSNNEALFDFYHPIETKLSKEFNTKRINFFHDSSSLVLDFFTSEEKIERSLTVLELILQQLDTLGRNEVYRKNATSIEIFPDEAILEFNFRMREFGIGYQYESSQMVRIDSTISHSEIIGPAINLLSSKRFRGANDEYLSAHQHYRYNRYKECLVNCLKAFESTIKIVCDSKGWAYDKTDPARKLIKVLVNNGLFQDFYTEQFTSFESLLLSGVPVTRNKLAGHGQGSEITEVSEAVAKYALNLTASNILFIVEISKTS
ncbi:STM4504/CBY_0614 family protein [Parachryseolinea silvisoli]|uniref:STM4504/CBY_0614 family protein n=1 Tax=Parachryseolinea silvisoli TaxID=2873601 RepID=UPI00226587F3|nr:hypothetical protein [Parachryseolinea silvisoli]MCD9019152.1 hypothetical protein [Parachryseolinea silvisoli]